MMQFRYRALAADGHTVSGVTAALSESDLEGRLARLGLHLLRARPLRPGAGGFGRRSAIDPRQRLDLLMQLEALLRAGVPLIEALDDLRQSAASPTLAELLAMVRDRIETGATLSQALAEHPAVFDAQTVGLVRAGEATGALPTVLARIVANLKWRDELAAKVRKALTYPAFVAVVVAAVVVFLMIYLVPQLVQFLRTMGQSLPLQTRLLIAVSEAFVAYWYLILAAPLAAAAAIASAARNSRQFRRWLDGWSLRLPLLGKLLQKVALARVANTFGLMYRSGVTVLDALQQCEQVAGNLAIAESIARARAAIATGASIADGFETTGLLPPLLIRMLRIGERTGDLDGALENVAYFYARDVDETVARLQGLIEPIITVALGAILGWVMIAVLGPVYETIGKIRA
jgi:type IV pilus assembly protein PilC